MNREQHRQCLHRRAVEYYREGTAKRWVTCLVASRLVGRYSKGLTIALATDLALSVDQVENLARAGLMYRMMRPRAADLPTLRRKLTPSHFAAMGELAIKHDLSPAQILDQLREAADKGMSVDIMRGTIGRGNPDPPSWLEELKRARAGVERVAQVGGAPLELWHTCTSFLDNTEGYLDE